MRNFVASVWCLLAPAKKYCQALTLLGMGVDDQSTNLEPESAVTLAASSKDAASERKLFSSFPEPLGTEQRRRLLIVSLLFYIVLVCYVPDTQGERHSPKHNQIERVYNETHSFLWNCDGTVCPKGYGLSVECGNSVSVDVEIECIPCIPGKTYSGSDDYQVCKACRLCGETQEVLGNCTVEKDSTFCGKCKEGHYKDSTDCQECSWCCNDTANHDRMPDCKDMPVNKQCRSQSNSHQCAPTTSDDITTGSHPSTSPTAGIGTTDKSSITTGSHPSTSHTSIHVYEVRVALGVTGSLFLVIVLSIIVWKKRRVILCWLKRAFRRSVATQFSQKTPTYVCHPNDDPESGHCACGLMTSDNSNGILLRPLSSEDVEALDISEDALDQRSGDHQLLAENINMPLVEYQIEDKTAPTSDHKEDERLVSTEEALRSKRADLLAKRVSNLPLRFHRKICALLNGEAEMVPDYRDLGERLGLQTWELRDLKRLQNPAGAVLQKFNSSTDGTVRVFIEHLEELERQDVIDVIYEWINEICPFQNNG